MERPEIIKINIEPKLGETPNGKVDLKFYADMHLDPPSTKEERRQHNLSLRPLGWRPPRGRGR